MIDHDEAKYMKELVKQFNEAAELHNTCITQWTVAEVRINLGIVQHGISDKWTWKKQMIELVRKVPQYEAEMRTYLEAKGKERICRNTMKALENEINVIKKIHDATPR